MEFEWDEEKRQQNIRHRRVDFVIAAQIFHGSVTVREDKRYAYGERRFRALGEFEGQHYVVAYTLRGQVHRIVTAWAVGQKGAKRYKALFARRSGSDA